jgi:hypothetical protein
MVKTALCLLRHPHVLKPMTAKSTVNNSPHPIKSLRSLHHCKCNNMQHCACNNPKLQKKLGKKGEECKYQGSRTTNNTALVAVLGTMAWTDELVLCLVPWHHTTQMCADSIHTIGCKLSIILYYQVSWITLCPNHRTT